MLLDFNFASIPHIIFGAGKLYEIYDLIPKFGNNVLYVIGGSSLKNSGKWDEIESRMQKNNISFSRISVYGEPTPKFVDDAVTKFRNHNIDRVRSQNPEIPWPKMQEIFSSEFKSLSEKDLKSYKTVSSNVWFVHLLLEGTREINIKNMLITCQTTEI